MLVYEDVSAERVTFRPAERAQPRRCNPQSPILVTGMHRSGTSWVGRMLAVGREVRYIDEPLNVDYAPRAMRGVVERWYQYICAENDSAVRPALAELLGFRYHAWIQRRGIRSTREALKAGEDFVRSLRHRVRRRTPLVKCPFCVFSIPWFIEQLDARVVVTLRDPLAVTSSLKRLNWRFGFQDLLAQKLLMCDVLEPFREPMQRCLARPDDIIGQGILLWRMIYQTVHQYRTRYPQIVLARHEDLSRRPVAGFAGLYQQLGLPFSERARRGITQASQDCNPAEAPLRAPRQIHLDSRANLDAWRHRLTPAEAARVRAATADVAELFDSPAGEHATRAA